MRTLVVGERWRNLSQGGLLWNIRRRKVSKQTNSVISEGSKKQAEPVTSAVLSQLANITFWNPDKSKAENIYDKTMFEYIGRLNETCPEKAMDLANRLKVYASCSDEYRLPKDWDYLISIYDNDYQFITDHFMNNDSLGEIEAMHRVKDEISDENEFQKYYKLPPRIIYPILEMRKEYPGQVNAILDNKQYRELLICNTGDVTYSGEMKEFAEFIRDDAETMDKTLGMFKGTNRYYPTNYDSPCNLSEALKYAKMMKANPEATTEILNMYPAMEPELLRVLINNYDNPYLIEDFNIYNSWLFNPFEMRGYEKTNDWHRSHYFSVPVEQTTLDDLDKFLKSGFLTRLNDLLAEKGKDLDNPDRDKREIAYHLDIHYHRKLSENSKYHEYNIRDWLEGMVSDRSSIYYTDKMRKRDYLRDILNNDQETFLRLVKDDILYLYNNEETRRIAKLYQKYPDKEITPETIRKYLDMDPDIADAFLQ